MPQPLTEDAKVVLLLCAEFGSAKVGVITPLNTREYDVLAKWLRSRKWRPADLLGPEGHQALKDGNLPLDGARIEKLLSRGLALALCVEKWTNKGMWVFCRSDAEGYPRRFKEYLKNDAPPVIYGVGDWHRLEQGGLAVWGIDHEGGAPRLILRSN